MPGSLVNIASRIFARLQRMSESEEEPFGPEFPGMIHKDRDPATSPVAGSFFAVGTYPGSVEYAPIFQADTPANGIQ